VETLGRVRERGLWATFRDNTIVKAVIEGNKASFRSYSNSPTGEVLNSTDITRYSDETMNPSFAPVFIEALLQAPMTQDVESSEVYIVSDIDNDVYLMLQGASSLLTDSLSARGAFNPSDLKNPILLKLGSLKQGERLKQNVVPRGLKDVVIISPSIEPSPCLLVVAEDLKLLHSSETIHGVHIHSEEDMPW
jgi:hypothetical protein